MKIMHLRCSHVSIVETLFPNFYALLLTRPCSVCNTADGVLRGVFSDLSQRCRATPQVKEHRCLPYCGLSTLNFGVVSYLSEANHESGIRSPSS